MAACPAGTRTPPSPVEAFRPAAPRVLRALTGLALFAVLLLLSACATRAVVTPHAAIGARIAQHALAQLDRPYRLGGADRDGFDCSGLALHAHALEGIDIPRTAAAQAAAGSAVERSALQPGDLVFFRFTGGRIDHVGVYVGDGAFVHAPGSGARVRRVVLDAPWFSQRFAGAARYWRVM